MRAVHIIGVPLDLGGGRRGVDMGPSALRIAGIGEQIAALGYTVVDRGDLPAPIPETQALRDEHKKYIRDIAKVCQKVYQTSLSSFDEGAMPLVLGGDHSIALGTLGGMASARGPGGVLWIDAHGDVNRPETTPTGNVHGMPLAAALGLAGAGFESEAWPLPAVDSGRVALVGVRQLDEGERQLLRKHDSCVFTMSDIDRLGVEKVMHDALEHVAGPNFVHVSLDMDVVDPDVAPGVGTPVPGGLSYREAHLACELIAESGLMESLEVVEVNPILDRENQTASLAVELVASALGARIL